MILKFPNLDVLRLALTTGAVPAAVSRTKAVAGFDDEGPVWVEPAAALSRAVQNELRKLGVQVGKTGGDGPWIEVSCWPELLPLQPDPRPLDRLPQTPVLFDLPGGEQLAGLVTEMLRLGNDRQSFRWLEPARALLRVVGPPYYSLLQALDRHGGTSAPCAFVEQGPGVWVELGYVHPLAEHLKPPEGKILLLRPPRQWIVLDDGPFRDVYEVMEFSLAEAATAWKEGEFTDRLRVAPRLTPAGGADVAEMWVLRDNAVEEINRFVQNSDDQLLHRLAFAIGVKDGLTIIVLRVRPSKLPPPALVLPAGAFRPYLKLPNLFLPCATRLRPPLRRDVVRRLLADDPDLVTWLTPGPDGSFTPESLPESAFRPLADWVDYVLDHEKEALQAWVQASQFDFEPFVCKDDQPAKTKKPPATERGRSGKRRETGGDEEMLDSSAISFTDKSRKRDDDLPEFVEAAVPEPNVAQKRLRALEERFLAAEGGLDAAERLALWPEMANLNSGLGNPVDAGLCWLNAPLWEQDEAPSAWAWAWFRAEAAAVPAGTERGLPRGRSWAAQAALTIGKAREVSGDDLDRLLRLAKPDPADVRALAAYLVWCGGRNPPSPSLVERLQPVQRFLETWERLLPVRAVWLAWSAVVRLAGGDVLALARARDRLLERLFQNGLRPEQDLPGFLRFAGQASGQRFRDAGQWMMKLRAKAHDWTKAAKSQAPEQPMRGYVDLIFSYGLARLGDHDASRELQQNAKALLGHLDDVHNFLLSAYVYRIDQALEGKPNAGPLPAAQIEYLDHLGLGGSEDAKRERKLLRYKVDNLRSWSRIVEPHERIDAYRDWRKADDLEKALNALTDVTDRDELAERVRRLMREAPKGARAAETLARILRTALNVAPRLGEAFARELLERVAPVYDALPEPREAVAVIDHAHLLEKALFVAAHFDRIEHVAPLVGRFQRMLQEQHGAGAVHAMESLAGQCLRGLRKLGMRDEIDLLLKEMGAVVLQGLELPEFVQRLLAALLKERRAGEPRPEAEVAAALRALLHLAAGWYYFGKDHLALPVLDAARSLLAKGNLPTTYRKSVACAYAAALGQAPPDLARQRLEDLFNCLPNLRDSFTTNSHYNQSLLQVLEAVVLAVASDDFTLGAGARRWLDEDEFLVRRRVHRDLRAAMSQTGG
jgi:hypothetical protein